MYCYNLLCNSLYLIGTIQSDMGIRSCRPSIFLLSGLSIFPTGADWEQPKLKKLWSTLVKYKTKFERGIISSFDGYDDHQVSLFFVSSWNYIMLRNVNANTPSLRFCSSRTTFGCIIGWCCSSCTLRLKFQRANVISGRSLCTRIITNSFVLLSQIMVTGPWNVPYPESTLHVKSFLFIVWNGGVAVWITVILVAMLDSSLKMRNEMRMHKMHNHRTTVYLFVLSELMGYVPYHCIENNLISIQGITW